MLNSLVKNKKINTIQFSLFFTKNVYISFNHLLSLQLTTLLTALCLVLLCHLLQYLWSVKHLPAHHAVQNDLNVHQKSWTDLIQCQFVLLLVDSFSENLVISKTDLIIFTCEIENVINYGCTFGMMFGHIQGACQ